MAQQRRSDASFPTLISELWELVRTYVTQETVGPLKGLGRSVALGVGGSIALAIGLSLLALAGLRALQTETGTTFDGNWSWAPYLLTLVGVAIVIGLALLAARKRSDGAKRAAAR